MSRTLFLFWLLALPAFASNAKPLRVITTTPDLAEIVRAVGGANVDTQSLLEGSEDIHFMDASPSFAVRLANSDLLFILGMDIESSWLPKIISRSGNARVQPGSAGYCNVSVKVQALDKPIGAIDRSMGDVHPQGNPHYNLDPLALKTVSLAVLDCLLSALPEKAEELKSNQIRFAQGMTSLHQKILTRLKSAFIGPTPVSFIEFHREFIYFFNTYGLKSIGAIEEKPGVPPSAARLAERARQAKNEHVRLALAAIHAPSRHLRKFEELSSVPFRQVPVMVQKNGPTNSIEKLQNLITDTVLDAIKNH